MLAFFSLFLSLISYVTSVEKYAETQLPPKSAFFNTITQSELSDADYTLIQTVWNTLGLKSLGDLCYLYLSLDIVHLSKYELVFSFVVVVILTFFIFLMLYSLFNL